MNPSIAKRRWHQLKKVHDKLLGEERALMHELGLKRKASYNACMELHRLAGLILQGGEKVLE